MPTFLRAHWKAILAIILLVLLATVSVDPRAMPADPAPAARLRMHVAALAAPAAAAPEQLADAGNYIEHALQAAGYRVRRNADGSGRRQLEAVLADAGPAPARGARTFIVGAHYYAAPNGAFGTQAPADADDNANGAAAVLELARAMKDVRPGPGTEVRFVFFLDPHAPPDADVPAADIPAADVSAANVPDAALPDSGIGSGSFVAYVGTLASSRQVQDALAAFQGANLPPRGLAAPAYMQGVTLADRASWPHSGGAAPALVMADTAFTRFPYRHADGADASPDAPPDERVYAGMARVVGALARTLTALAAGQQG